MTVIGGEIQVEKKAKMEDIQQGKEVVTQFSGGDPFKGDNKINLERMLGTMVRIFPQSIPESGINFFASAKRLTFEGTKYITAPVTISSIDDKEQGMFANQLYDVKTYILPDEIYYEILQSIDRQLENPDIEITIPEQFSISSKNKFDFDEQTDLNKKEIFPENKIDFDEHANYNEKEPSDILPKNKLDDYKIDDNLIYNKTIK